MHQILRNISNHLPEYMKQPVIEKYCTRVTQHNSHQKKIQTHKIGTERGQHICSSATQL